MIRPMCRPIIRPLVRAIQTGDTNPPYGIDVFFGTAMMALPSVLVKAGATYTRNSPKTVYQNNALVTLAANQFGTTYDAVTGLHAYEAEPAATNLATNSAGAAATWTVTNVVDAVTPISGFAASLAFGDNSVDRSAYKGVAVTSGVTYTVSVFIEMDDGGAPVVGLTANAGDFNLVSSSNTTTTQLVTRVGTSNIYRVSGLFANTVTATRNHGVIKRTTQSARTFRVIGIQVETGSRSTSYIATAGSTVTRAADVLSCAVANIPGFSAAGYTLVADNRRDVAGTGTGFILSAEVTGNDRAALRDSQYSVISGGVSQAGVAYVPGVARAKIALSCAANSFIGAVNGVALTADTSGSMPVGPTTLQIGCSIGAFQFNGYIYRVRLIPTALNQAQTTGLTV